MKQKWAACRFNYPLVLDSGSQRSYITDDLRKRLKLTVIRKEKNSYQNFRKRRFKTLQCNIIPAQFIVGQKVSVIECSWSPFICSDSINQSTRFFSKNYSNLNGLFLADTSPDSNKENRSINRSEKLL